MTNHTLFRQAKTRVCFVMDDICFPDVDLGLDRDVVWLWYPIVSIQLSLSLSLSLSLTVAVWSVHGG